MLRLKHHAAAALALALAVAVPSAFAQKAAAPKSEEDKMAKEVIHEKPNEFKIIASRSPVKAFVVLRDVVWFATEENVVCQSLVAAKGALHQQYQKLDKISSAGVTSMAADNQGNVWIANEEGVAVARGKNITSYTSADGAIPEGKVLAVAAGSGVDVWIGTENGAARFNGSSWTKYTTSDGLPSNKVQAVVANSRGEIYLGTNKGLSVYSGSSFQTYNAKNTGGSGPEWNDIKVLAKEPNTDVVWMADGPKNLNTFDGKTWNRYNEVEKGITSIMNDTHRTWFGYDGGLLRFNGEVWSGKEMHGIPVEQVFAMQRDANGNLCFGMEKGVMILSNPYRR
jgi:ligand-binding sensor domain-containing protein